MRLLLVVTVLYIIAKVLDGLRMPVYIEYTLVKSQITLIALYICEKCLIIWHALRNINFDLLK